MYKVGDKIDFLHISWDEESWEFGSPSILLEPEFREYEDQEDIEYILDELVQNLDEEGYVLASNLKSAYLSKLKKIASNRINGGNYWDKLDCIVTKGTLELIQDGDILYYKIINSEEY